MNLKQLSAMIVFFVAVGTAMAVIISPFTGWDDLTRKSPDIVIARCATTPNPTVIGDGMISSDVEVLSVLKGDTKPGVAHMVSQYWPHQHERFLMFATYALPAAPNVDPTPAVADVEGAASTLMELAHETKDPDAKWRAVRALGYLRYKRAVPLLIECLKDEHHYVRANAARALGDMRVKSASAPLTDLLKSEKNGGVIEQTSHALAVLQAREAVPVLKHQRFAQTAKDFLSHCQRWRQRDSGHHSKRYEVHRDRQRAALCAGVFWGQGFTDASTHVPRHRSYIR